MFVCDGGMNVCGAECTKVRVKTSLLLVVVVVDPFAVFDDENEPSRCLVS